MGESLPIQPFGSIVEADQLEFDFDFDELENSSDADVELLEDQAKPYQWSANVQFVNIDLNKMGLKPHASNNVPYGNPHEEQTVQTTRSATSTNQKSQINQISN